MELVAQTRSMRSRGKLLDFNSAGAAREGWGPSQRRHRQLIQLLTGSGPHSTDFLSGGLCEPEAIPAVMPGPCLVVHWCLIQLQGGTWLQCYKGIHKIQPFLCYLSAAVEVLDQTEVKEWVMCDICFAVAKPTGNVCLSKSI